MRLFPIMLPLLAPPDPPGGGGGAPPPPPQTVDYATYQAAVSGKTAAEAELARVKGELTKATERGATVDALTGQVNEWKGKAEKAEGRFSMFTEFSGAIGSTNTKVIDQFDAEYGALPEKDRPTRKAWVDGLKAKLEEAPEHLRPFLATAAPAGGNGAPPKPPQPKVPGTPPTPPGAPSSLSKEEIKKIREDAIRTGDWSKWKAHRKSLGLEK